MSRRTAGFHAACALALVLLSPAITAAQSHFPADEDLAVMLRYLVEDGETPGIVIGILEADGSTRILHHGDGGEGALPLGPRSVFELGSITKAFTGILLADMVDRGEVALSDAVSGYLPDHVTVPSRNGREITLLDLATHHSSLPRMPDNMERDDDPYPEYTIEDLYAFLSSHELRRDIGTEFEYSNIAVALLGHALERAAGASYEELLRQRILDPLGMDMTTTIVEGGTKRWMTRGRDDEGGTAAYRNWPNLPAMGAIRSNAEDMLKFIAANVGPPESRLERVMRDAYEPRARAGDGAEVGLNWRILRIGDRRIVTHSGGTQGFGARIAFDPDAGVGMVRLANTAGFDDDIGLDFVRRGAPLAIPEVDVDAKVLETYAGAYGPGSEAVMAVRVEPEGYLTLQALENVRFRMYAESDTSFFLKRTPWRFAFTRNEAGEVTGVAANLEGREERLRKLDLGRDPHPPAVVAGNAAIDLPLRAEEKARYVGVYAITVGEQTLELRVFVEDGELMGQPQGSDPHRLLHQGEHEFVPEGALDFRLDFEVVNGRAETVTIDNEGTEYRGTRQRGR